MSDQQPSLTTLRFLQIADGQLQRIGAPLVVPAGQTISVSVEDADGNILRSYLQTRPNEVKY
jgi:hypothetical protein